jgi:hypothetical protein
MSAVTWMITVLARRIGLEGTCALARLMGWTASLGVRDWVLLVPVLPTSRDASLVDEAAFVLDRS